jgi:Flp pilus assembly pilin Flp
MKKPRRFRDRQSGISYIEVLIAAALIAVTLVPMMDAVRTATVSTGVHEEAAVQNLHLIATLENVLAEPFSSLEAAATAAGSESTLTSYSDLAGLSNRRLVFLSLYDGDNADADNDPYTGTDQGLMWVRVEIEGTAQAIETLISQ